MICKNLKECFIVDMREKVHDLSLCKSIGLCMKSSSFLAVVLLRISQYCWQKRFVWRLSLYLKRLNEILTGFECHLEATIGKGLFIPHTQNVVIGAGVILGENVTLYNGITLGALAIGSGEQNQRYPHVGSNVTIYTGAKVIGPISIGYGAVIGANSVVLKNVPRKAIAVGVPAKIIEKPE
jgi:serine O-acetyltransferase